MNWMFFFVLWNDVKSEDVVLHETFWHAVEKLLYDAKHSNKTFGTKYENKSREIRKNGDFLGAVSKNGDFFFHHSKYGESSF